MWRYVRCQVVLLKSRRLGYFVILSCPVCFQFGVFLVKVSRWLIFCRDVTAVTPPDMTGVVLTGTILTMSTPRLRMGGRIVPVSVHS